MFHNCTTNNILEHWYFTGCVNSRGCMGMLVLNYMQLVVTFPECISPLRLLGQIKRAEVSNLSELTDRIRLSSS